MRTLNETEIGFVAGANDTGLVDPNPPKTWQDYIDDILKPPAPLNPDDLIVW